MINLTERLSSRLIKPWTSNGVLVFRGQAHYVEVEVPMLALDAEAVARAVAGNLQYVKRPGYPEQALGSDVTEEQHQEISTAWRRELAVAENDLTLAAAILARRACVSPLRVPKNCLDFYAGRHLWRGGTAKGDPGMSEFLFIAEGSSPTIYVATEALAAVTRFVGAEYLSVRVTEDELRLRIADALEGLERSEPPALRSLTNIEDWLTGEEPQGENDDDR